MDVLFGEIVPNDKRAHLSQNTMHTPDERREIIFTLLHSTLITLNHNPQICSMIGYNTRIIILRLARKTDI
jgi:hypothetical protein